MKRLKSFLLNMKPADETYREMYEGKLCETCEVGESAVHNQAIYWWGEIGYEITRSNRLELSRPTVTIHIPLKMLKLQEAGTAALDYIFRAFIPYVRTLNELNDNRKRTHRENGHYDIYEPGPEVLVRNVVRESLVAQKYYKLLSGCAIRVLDDREEIPSYSCVSIMLQVQLPEKRHKKGIQMLAKDLPETVNCFVNEFDGQGLQRALALWEKQEAIRTWLRENGHCAFVADGSILPRAREGGGPLAGAVPFVSTPEDQVEIAGVRGMLFRRGVTVITGGGYSGKSTLLDALSAGIYNHVEGDGRELVLTDQSAMKISAEDGRSVRHVNLSPFIKWMPGGDPADFSTDHASGSTSQAANVMEAVGWGVKLLLIDEDKSATNFMIQDPVMRILVEKEPVTPFVDRVRELQERKGVSTILVIGGSSEYLHVADKIYLMRDYVIREVTEAAGKLQASFWGQGEPAAEGSKAPLTAADFSNGDLVDANGLNTRPRGSSTEVLEVSDFGFLILGREQVDIRMLHNIVSVSQLNAAAFLLRRMFEKVNGLDRFQKYALGNRSGGMDGADGSRRESTLEEGESAGAKPRWICRREQVELLMEEIQEKGLEFVYSTFFSQCGRWLDLPRKYEVLAVLSRMRMDP